MYDYEIVKENIENILENNVHNKPVGFIMIGLPASGKSTLINKLQKDFGIKHVLSTDTLAEEYAEKNNLTYKAAIKTNFKEFKKEMQNKASLIKINKEDFIWDQVNSNKNIREAKVRMFKNDFYVIGILMNPTSEQILNRMIDRKLYSDKDLSSAMIFEMSKLFSMPEISEGFKEILVVGEKICKISENSNFKMNSLDLSKEALEETLIQRGLLKKYYEVYKEKKEMNVIMKDRALKLKK